MQPSTERLARHRKFRRVMTEYGEGKLRSSSGEKVTTPEQAKAIAFSEARRAIRESMG